MPCSCYCHSTSAKVTPCEVLLYYHWRGHDTDTTHTTADGPLGDFVAACVMGFITIGTRSTVSSFLKTIIADLGTNRETISFVVATNIWLSGFLQPFAGRFMDRCGSSGGGKRWGLDEPGQCPGGAVVSGLARVRHGHQQCWRSSWDVVPGRHDEPLAPVNLWLAPESRLSGGRGFAVGRAYGHADSAPPCCGWQWPHTGWAAGHRAWSPGDPALGRSAAQRAALADQRGLFRLWHDREPVHDSFYSLRH